MCKFQPSQIEIKKVLTKLIHETLKRFMKRSYIVENIRRILETIDITNENNLSGMIFFQILKKLSTVLITNIYLNV